MLGETCLSEYWPMGSLYGEAELYASCSYFKKENRKDRHFHHFTDEKNEDQKHNLPKTHYWYRVKPLIGNQTPAAPKAMFLPNKTQPLCDYTENKMSRAKREQRRTKPGGFQNYLV